MEKFLDQFADVWDIQYCGHGLKLQYREIELVKRYIGLARLHLHAAAAIVTGGYDYQSLPMKFARNASCDFAMTQENCSSSSKGAGQRSIPRELVACFKQIRITF
jgi:hypothetical protein